jgi:single-stranded-DNA-specific exonuclease
MAAGLSVPTANLTELQFGLIDSITKMMEANKIEPTIPIDAYVDPTTIDLDLLLDLSRLAPFGPGNPPLRFAAKSMSIVSTSTIGKTKEHLRVNLQSSAGADFHCVWWQGAGLPQPESRFDLIFHARANNFKDKVEVQFEWEDFRESEEDTFTTRNSSKKTSAQNFDFRTVVDPVQKLVELSEKIQLQIWSEGSTTCPLQTVDHLHLKPALPLAIWSIPPSPKLLHQVIETIKPSQIYWFAVLPLENDLGTFIQQTVRQIKKLLNQGDKQTIALSALAAAQAATVTEIAILVKWLCATGEVSIISLEKETAIIIAQKSEPDPTVASSLQKELIRLHKEVAAYRQFYLHAESVELLLPTH